jgi:hypothetical protein
MPRITETLKQDLGEAAELYRENRDRGGGIGTSLVQTRALIEIADALKGIETALTTIAKATQPGDRTTLEAPPAGAESSGKRSDARSRKRTPAKK